MKRNNKIYKLVIGAAMIICCSSKVQSQVNGFTLACPGGVQSAGISFPVNVSFNWTNTTTSATATINYNPALLTYDASCSAVLPSCMALSNNSITGVLTINISSLSACNNTGAISFNVCFQFKCPDTCAGVNKTATLNATLTDNLSTTQNANCSVTGNTPNAWTLQHYFHSYNAVTNEITFKALVYNFNCFLVKNPAFTVALSPGCSAVLVNAWGINNTYTFSGFTITPTATAWQYVYDTLYYTIKIPCGTCTNTLLTSNITLKGQNCGVPNTIIKGPVAASFNIPNIMPSAPVSASLITAVYVSPNRFWARVTNTGTTAVNGTLTNYLPLVHATSVLQNTNQVGIGNSIKYYDCSLSPSSSYPLVGNGATNSSLPANTKKYELTINNLLPGNYVDITTYFNLTSSCSGPAGPPPYKDSVTLCVSCVTPPPLPCLICTGIMCKWDTVTYAPKPLIQCVSSTNIGTCHNIGDTLDFCYEFKNNGDAALLNGVFTVPNPGWLQIIPSTITYTGFSPNPVSTGNAIFNLPTIPVGTSSYKICFKVVINSGAAGGTTPIWTTAVGSNMGTNWVCYGSLNICAYAAIGVDKKVKGSLDGSYGSSGNGIAGSLVDYEVTLRNTGTIPVNNLVVIDRIPYPNNVPASDLTILGNPNSILRGSQFNMQMAATPVVTSCTVNSSNDPNVCTGWTGVGSPCGPPAVGTWTGGNKAYKFTFNSSVTIAPGGTLTFYFQLKIPTGTPAGLHACNTAGFIAKTTAAYPSYTINPVESPIVCVEVKETDPPPPGGCCKDLLKKIKEQHSVSNDILTVNLTLTAGPKKLKKVTVSLVQFEVKHPKDCDVCVKDPKLFGNIVPGNNNLPWTTAPASVPFTHLIAWQDSVGMDWSNGVPVNFTIPLPPRSPIACCCDTIYYCLRYTFTDTACVMCDTTICYKTYNGKDCKDLGGGNNNNPVCTCEIKPVFHYESPAGVGSKNVTCGDIINLFAGNIYTTVIPNFTCKDQNGNDCPGSSISVIIKKPDNTTQVLTGPTYNYTYTLALPGTYEYTITAICGGKDCICKFQVVIPQH